MRLTAAAQTDIIGLSKSLKVLPGDVINAEVYAKYLSPTTTNTSVPAQLLTAITSSFGVSAASSGEAGVLYNWVRGMDSMIKKNPDELGPPGFFVETKL